MLYPMSRLNICFNKPPNVVLKSTFSIKYYKLTYYFLLRIVYKGFIIPELQHFNYFKWALPISWLHAIT